MRRPRPVFLKWTTVSEAMVGKRVFLPHPSFEHYCAREYQDEEVYPMITEQERSSASNGHFHAALKEGFNNLSEENARHFPSVHHLRKWALVQCGYCTETNYVLENSKEARKLAADIRKRDEYAVIKIRDRVVQVFDAESQSKAAMKKDRFEKSKNDVLDLVASMSRTTRPQLMQNAGRSR